MKQLKYLYAIIIATLSLSACELEGENIFSTAPVAPELYNTSDIIMTSNTMEEDVNFAWAKARYIGEDISYEVRGHYTYEDNAVAIFTLGTSTEPYLTLSKAEFKTKLYENVSDLPVNTTFSLSFDVIATGSVVVESEKKSLTIFAFGDAVSPIVTPTAEEIVLDKTTPTAELSLISWTPARLGYEEEITYGVFLKYAENAEYELANGLTTLSYSTTVDALNEAAIAAGAAEDAASNFQLFVKAYSASVVDGVASTYTNIMVTTYLATFPDFMYLPGSHQGWDPASAPKIAQSTATKGLYEAIVTLTTADATETAFKFSPNPAWDGDFAIDNIEITDFAGTYKALIGSGTTGGDIKIPNGTYNVVLNKKLNTLQMFQIGSIGVIGEAVGGWDADKDMTYDAATNTYSIVTNLVSGKEYKFRVNDDWTYSFGGTESAISSTTGSNIVYNGTDGEYKIVLDVNTNPYTIKYINTSFPENLQVPGNHQGWSPTTAPVLKGDGAGKYQGYVSLDGEFKFTSSENTENGGWDPDNWGGTFDALVHRGDNLRADKGNYWVMVDLTTLTLPAFVKIDKFSAIGAFNSWSADAEFTYDTTDGKYKIDGLDIAEGTEFKFRVNGAWDHDFGGTTTTLSYKGANLVAPAGGVQKIEVDLTNLTIKLN